MIAHGLDTRGRRSDTQCRVQRILKVLSDRFRIAAPARFGHALCDAFPDMGSGPGHIQSVQEGNNGLQIAEISLRHFPSLLNG